MKRVRLPTLLLAGLLVFYLALLFRAGGPPAPLPTPADQAVDRLLELMSFRLRIMHDVARWKWNAKQAVADPARERAFLDDMRGRAKEAGIEPDRVEEFFAAQIEAARLVQEADFRQWQADQQGPFADVPDLQTELRPRIDEVSRDLLDALARVEPILREKREHIAERARRIFADFPEEVRGTAIAPLVKP